MPAFILWSFICHSCDFHRRVNENRSQSKITQICIQIQLLFRNRLDLILSAKLLMIHAYINSPYYSDQPFHFNASKLEIIKTARQTISRVSHTEWVDWGRQKWLSLHSNSHHGLFLSAWIMWLGHTSTIWKQRKPKIHRYFSFRCWSSLVKIRRSKCSKCHSNLIQLLFSLLCWDSSSITNPDVTPTKIKEALMDIPEDKKRTSEHSQAGYDFMKNYFLLWAIDAELNNIGSTPITDVWQISTNNFGKMFEGSHHVALIQEALMQKPDLDFTK